MKKIREILYIGSQVLALIGHVFTENKAFVRSHEKGVTLNNSETDDSILYFIYAL
jgi:hypothetical protein